MIKVDLHTHSSASPDGGLTQQDYMQLIGDNVLDYVAITDHNAVHFALELQAALGDKIIVGEEVMSDEGEIVGLFLRSEVRAGMPLRATAEAIKAQGGLVYIPHPFETVRKGVSEKSLDAIADLVDIVEVYNGRAVVQNRGPQAAVWARLHQKATAASSDAHGSKGVGTAYTTIKQAPTASNLVSELQTGHMTMHRPPLRSLLYPKVHRLRKKVGRNHG